MRPNRFDHRIRNLEDHRSAVMRIRRQLDFFPENGRRGVGYSLEDCKALIFAVLRNDRPMRTCREERGTEQSWLWLRNVSGIPPRTLGRILSDYVYMGREEGSSLLNIAAHKINVHIDTEARSQILSVVRRGWSYAGAPRRVDSVEDDEFEGLLEGNSAHISYGESRSSFLQEDEDV